MTTFYGPVQNRRNLGWKFCSSNSRGGHPIGACGEHDDHPTADEAQTCFNAWARDHIELREQGTTNWCDCGVKGCSNPAKALAEVQGVWVYSASLCPEHFNQDGAISALHLNATEGTVR